MTAPKPSAGTPARLLSFDDLDGWDAEDHAAAMAVFRTTCSDIADPVWQGACARAGGADPARTFFETRFRPVLIGGDRPALFTGYFEPELAGARAPCARFRHPVYRCPPELVPDTPWLTRAEIETSGALAGRGLEIAWVDDPVALFFLHVQGSGRIHLIDGTLLRVGFAGRNRQPYRSVGAEMVRRGLLREDTVSAQAIADWIRRHPEEGRRLLHHNPSYIFFRTVEIGDPAAGPIGAMNRSVTPLRTIAVDPAFTPLGAPVWIETHGSAPMRRLMIAQDKGSAITGPQRADIFFGTGEDAGRAAGVLRDPGRMIVLLPVDAARRAVRGA